MLNPYANRAFWEEHPVAAAAITNQLGSPEWFAAFDSLRERDDCEPAAFSEMIHGYGKSKGKRVLDFGCGNGYVLERYARTGAEVHGVDVTERTTELSQARFALRKLNGTFTRVEGPLPYPDNHFDIVCSMGVLHHIENPRPAVEELHRVLKPGGRLIAMLYYKYSWNNLVLLRLKRLLHPAYRGLSQQEAVNRTDGPDCPWARTYSRSEAKELLSAFEGLTFRVNQISYRQLLLPGAERFLPSLSDSLLARTLGWCLYIDGHKPA